MSVRVFGGLLVIIPVLSFSGVTCRGQLSGRYALDLIARRVPTTLADEIVLDTPSEFALLEFGIASNLDLRIDLGFADLVVDATVNMAGPEHLVLKANAALGEVDIYGVILEGVSMVPEMWFAVPFEAVTDVNNLPKSVVIPPGDLLFVKARLTSSLSYMGFSIKHLAMLEDINFPDPGLSYDPLYYPSQSPSLKPSFAIGSLITVLWKTQFGASISSVTGISAQQATNSIKGHSASGRVKPGFFFESFSISGIKLGDICFSTITLHNAQVGISVLMSSDPTKTASVSCLAPTCLNPIQTPSGSVSFSARVNDQVAVSSSLMLFRQPAGAPAIGLSGRLGPFQFSVRLDLLEVTSLSASYNTSLNLGAMTGSFGAVATGLERGMTGLSMRLSLSQGIFSAGTSVSFAQRPTRFGFASMTGQLTFRFSPATVSVRATFGRYGLSRASISFGVVF